MKFLLIQAVYSVISLQIINDVNNKVFVNSNERLLYSFINPIFGKFFCESGCLRNLRYYGSDISPGFFTDSKGYIHRNYSEDKGESSVMQLILHFFPSSNGILTTIENSDNNFSKKFFCSKNKTKKYIDKLSEIFVKILRKETLLNQKSSNERSSFSKFIEKFFLLSIDKSQDTQLKLLIIHSYVLNLFDTQYEYNLYLEGILKRLSDVEKDSVDILELSDIQKEEFKKLTDNFTEFPYSKFNQPPTGSSIPICYKTKNNYSYDKIRTFSDNTEMVILQICQFLFYDEKLKRYSLDHLKLEKFSPLLNFFEKYSKGIFTITKEIRNDWSKVVQCLEDQFNEKNRKHIIQYMNNKFRNEISPGIINILCVLTNICNLNKNCIYETCQESTIAIKMKKIFQSIASPKINVECGTIGNRIVKKIDSRNEFFGDFSIILTSKVNDIEIKTKFILIVSQSHAKVIFVSRINSLDNIPNFENLLKIDKKESLMSSLLRQYLILLKNDGSKLETPKSLFNILFIQGPLILNQEIRNYLTNLLERKNTLELSNICIPDIDKVYNNVLKSVPLTDENTKNIFEPFYYFDIKDENSIFNIWYLINKTNYDLKSEKLREIWDLKVNKECNVNKLALSYRLFSIERVAKMLDVVHAKLKKLSLREYPASFYQDTFLHLLNKNTVLCSLKILFTDFKSLSLKPMIKNLKSNKTISELAISGGELGNDNLNFIGELLGNNTTLKSLNISGNKIETAEIAPILVGIQKSGTLISLDISNNNLGAYNVEKIVNSIKKDTKLTSLDISSNNIESKGAEQIAKCLESNNILKSLNIKNNSIGAKGLRAIFDSLMYNTRLKSLDISENDINLNNDSLTDVIFEGLIYNNTLTELNISACKLNCSYVKALVGVLNEISKITILNLSKNEIKSDDIVYLFNSLVNNENLTKLNISNNYLGIEGAEAIAEYLKNNKKLTSLDLCQCMITSEGLNKIFDALFLNSTLVELRILNNGLKEEDFTKIYDLLKANKTLIKLDLYEVNLKNECENAIKNIMARRTSDFVPTIN